MVNRLQEQQQRLVKCLLNIKVLSKIGCKRIPERTPM